MARRAPLGLLPRLIHCQHFPPFALSSACSIFSSESFQSNRRHVCVCAPSLSRVRLFSTPWTVACQAPLSKGFSRQEYWGELPFPSPGDLPNPGTEPASAGGFFITASCTMSWTSIHSSSGTLWDLIPWIYLSLPLYNCKAFDFAHT